MRAVVDPNVLISAAVAAGVSAEFRRWIPESDADLFVDRIERESDAWPDPENVRPVTGDPKGDYLVALYRACDADVLVSGDRDLTSLDEPDVTVLTPAELLEQL